MTANRAVGLVIVAAATVAIALALGFPPDQLDPPASTTTSAVTSTTTTHATTSPPTSAATTTTAAPTTTVPAGPAVVVRRGDPSRMLLALTFDAGSDTGYAAAILDTLAATGVRATFGMTGRWAEANPALVRRMVAEGHQLVNHSYDHPSFTGLSTGGAALSQAARLDQLRRAEVAVQAAGGGSMLPWFRPPYGDEDESVRADVALAGYRYELTWTVDSLGWKGVPADEVRQRCVDQAVPGAIFLLHVGSASTDHAALAGIIDDLRARGYGFVTAADLPLA